MARRKVPVSMSSSCCSSHKQLEAPTSLEAISTRETAQLLRRGVELIALISRLGDTHAPRFSATGCIDISAFHCPRGQVLTHVANLNCPFAPSHGLFRGRFPSWILSFGFQLCLRLAESSAQSSSQSEDHDAEFIKMHMSDRRRWQDGGSAVS